MMTINMNSMSLKAIGKEVCLQARSLFGLSKDFRPKRHPNTWRKYESKEINVFMKMEKGGVHHNKYNDCCTKQWI
jgi:hypothetical protein